jgi:hypothetical protein
MSEQDTWTLDERLREDADLIHAYATGVYDDIRDRIVSDLRDAADALSAPSPEPRYTQAELNEAVQLAIERTKQNIAEGRLPSPDVPTQGLEIAELWRRELYPHLGQEIFNELFADTSEKGWNDIRAEVAAVKKITAHLTAELQRLREGLNELAEEVKHNSTVRDEYQEWERIYELLAALTHPPSDQGDTT